VEHFLLKEAGKLMTFSQRLKDGSWTFKTTYATEGKDHLMSW
jgi:hypothetical protein